jgi:hypothetical protein
LSFDEVSSLPEDPSKKNLAKKRVRFMLNMVSAIHVLAKIEEANK